MTVERVFLSLKREIRLIIISVLAFLVILSIISFFLIKPKYEASSKIFVGKPKIENVADEYTNEEVVMYQMMTKTYTEMLKSKDFVKYVTNISGQEISVSDVLSRVQFNPITDTQIMDIKYISSSKEESYNLVYAFAEQFVLASTKLYPNVNIQVLEQPKVPVNKVSPNNALYIVIAGLLGVFFGIALVLIKEYFNNSINSKEELEKLLNITTLGIIPAYKE